MLSENKISFREENLGIFGKILGAVIQFCKAKNSNNLYPTPTG